MHIKTGLKRSFQEIIAVPIVAGVAILLWFLMITIVDALHTGLSTLYPSDMADSGVSNLMSSWWSVPALLLVAGIFWSLVVSSRRKRLTGVYMVLLLLLSSSMGPVPLVSAGPDGSKPAIGAECYIQIDRLFNEDMTDDTPSSGELSAESYWRAESIQFPVSGWSWMVYDLDAYIDSTGSDGSWLSRAYIYSIAGSSDMGAQLIESAIQDFNVPDGVKYYTYPMNEEITQDAVYAVVWGESSGAQIQLRYESVARTNNESLYDAVSFTGSLPDPMTGEETNINDLYHFGIALDVLGTDSIPSTNNSYWGNATHYTVRREINGSIGASPIITYNSSMRIFYPKTEALLNISYNNAGAWALVPGSAYSTGDYNRTHYYLRLDDTALETYGEDFLLYFQSYPYTFIFNGLYYENGTFIDQIEVTAHLTEGSQSFNVSGQDNGRGFNEVPLMFTWTLSGGGGSRTYYPQSNGEEIWLTHPEVSYSTYSFDIIDYTGRIGFQDSYLYIQRLINSSLVVVQKMVIESTAQDVPFIMAIGEAYMVKCELGDGSVQSFGWFVPGVDSNPSLVLRPQSFSGSVKMSQAYLYFESFRSQNLKIIQGEYNDTGDNTDLILFEVRLLNGSSVYSDSASADQATFQYNSADNETDYIVWMRAVTPSSYFGNITYFDNHPANGSAVAGFNFSSLGSLPAGQTGQGAPQNLFSLALCLSMVSAVSVANAPLGLGASILLGYVFNEWGWMSNNTAYLSVALSFVVVFIIATAKRYIGGPG